jgi:para-aminobenzoate synthetase component 1
MTEFSRRILNRPAGRESAGDAIAESDREPGSEGAGDAIGGGDTRKMRVGAVTSSLTESEFMAGVERIREYIRAGDLFQANLTRRISCATPLTGADLYHRLLRESPAPFAAYLDCGEMEIASISPELFLSLRGRHILTSPIKGTAPRGTTLDDDQALRNGLAASEKNRAENIMIVDLLRNDLSRVSLPGTIAVPRLAEIETHPTVHHLVSTVTGTLAPDLRIVDLLRATFPGGSITGAPKIRAMEVLRELEPVRRGVYTGAIGIIGWGGDADLSIAIRTTTLRDGVAHYGTGGGVTLASTPAEEWAETEEKAKAFRLALEVE